MVQLIDRVSATGSTAGVMYMLLLFCSLHGRSDGGIGVFIPPKQISGYAPGSLYLLLSLIVAMSPKAIQGQKRKHENVGGFLCINACLHNISIFKAYTCT